MTKQDQPLPQPAPETPTIAAPRDVDFPGTIKLFVQATDLERRIFHVREIIPVAGPGPMTLLYPKWLPGYHSPEASIELFAGLIITAAGERIRWRRDPVEVHAFHLEIPEGAAELIAEFQFLSPTHSGQGRVVVTPEMLNLQWNNVILYPAGHFSRRIMVEADLTLPDGWNAACAVETLSVEGNRSRFKRVTLDALVDSPVFAGKHLRRIELDPQGPVALNIVADRAELLDITPDQIGPIRELIGQADLLFGARHFDHYDFLLALSDELGSIGVEHHRSCETGVQPSFFTDWQTNFAKRDVIAHEYVHSWNGKFRRGVDSWTPSFDRPIRNSLMWVYEGQTQYWGHVLTTRAGLWTLEQALGALAQTAATYDIREGHRWRPMSDTTRDPVIASRSPLPWASWQRSEDYYSEGQLVWLDVDTRLRELSGDQKSLDDFAARFFGGDHASYQTKTYDFDEVVATLDAIAPFDWKAFLVDKLENTEPGAPLEGLTRGGYRLVYRDTPGSYTISASSSPSSIDLLFSVGLMLNATGLVNEVIWGSPAFDAGLTTGSTIAEVNRGPFNEDAIRQAVIAAQDGSPIALLLKSGNRERRAAIRYSGGMRYPHLEPIVGARRRLDEIYAARAVAHQAELPGQAARG